MREIVLLIISLTLINCSLGNRLEQQIAAHNMQKICIAERKYVNANNGKYGSISDLVSANLLSSEMTKKEIKGYRYELTITETGYVARAIPVNFGTDDSLAYHTFYVDEKNNYIFFRHLGYSSNGYAEKTMAGPNDSPYFGDDGKPLICEE